MPYLGLAVTQIDGTRFAQSNCGPAVTAGLIDQTTVGRYHVTPAQVRNRTGDVSGGVEGGVLAAAANEFTNREYPFLYLKESDFKDVRMLLETMPLGIIIDCSKTINTKYRTNSFTGLHWWELGAGTEKDGTIKAQDPGTTSAGWFRVPLDLVKRACLVNGFYWFLKTPATHDVRKTATMAVAVREKPSRDSRVLRRLAKGDTVHVIKTRKGGPWKRDDGSAAHGWHVLKNGFVKGEGLR